MDKGAIKLTQNRHIRGFSVHTHGTAHYTIEDTFYVYITDEVRKEMSKKRGRYKCWAYMRVPNRKKEIRVSIGFDENGRYQTSNINHGKGYFSKKVQSELFDKLIVWLIADGWAELIED